MRTLRIETPRRTLHEAVVVGAGSWQRDLRGRGVDALALNALHLSSATLNGVWDLYGTTPVGLACGWSGEGRKGV